MPLFRLVLLLAACAAVCAAQNATVVPDESGNTTAPSSNSTSGLSAPPAADAREALPMRSAVFLAIVAATGVALLVHAIVSFVNESRRIEDFCTRVDKGLPLRDDERKTHSASSQRGVKPEPLPQSVAGVPMLSGS